MADLSVGDGRELIAAHAVCFFLFCNGQMIELSGWLHCYSLLYRFGKEIYPLVHKIFGNGVIAPTFSFASR